MPSFRILPAVLLLASVSGCTRPDAAPPRLLVSAASDLALAMPELTAAFEAESGIRVVANLGSSGQLAQQILHGAPVDVFLSADRSWIDRLREAGRVAPEGAAVYAYGRLVLYGREIDDDAGPTLLRDPRVRRIAMANPEHAPYGRAAREALERAGVWPDVEPKLVIGESVRQAAQMVDAGGVDVAIVAWSLMRDGTHRYALLPETLHAPLEQAVAVVAGRPAEDAARAFVRFLLGAEGRAILERYHFVVPEPDRFVVSEPGR